VFVFAAAQVQPAGQNVQEFDARVFVQPVVLRRDRFELGQLGI